MAAENQQETLKVPHTLKIAVTQIIHACIRNLKK